MPSSSYTFIYFSRRAFAGLCYADLSMIPVAGSAYTYSMQQWENLWLDYRIEFLNMH
jgi:hypothetical protein